MTLFVSLVVIIGVAAIVGRICSRSRPGDRDLGDGISLPDTGHHSGWAHTHGHTPGHVLSHDSGGWGGDVGGGDSGGGGGGD